MVPEPGFSRRATALAAVAALAVTLAVVAVVAVVVDHPGRPTPRATPVQSAQECADVLVLGASGSGERSTGQADLGPTLEAFRRAYAVAGRGSGRTVEALYVGRETAAPRQLRDPVSPRGSVIRSSSRSSVRAWEGDLAGDTTRILDALTAARSLCPDQQIVLAGYSQGAMAVHATLTRLAARPQVFGRVVAAVLVADGHRVAGTQARLAGAPAARRGALGVHGLRLAPVPDVPADGWAVPVWSVCSRDDLVCQVSDSPFAAAAAVHRSYAAGAGTPALERVAQRVWARTARWARPVHGWVPLPGTVGVRMSQQVPALIAPRQRTHVVYQALTPLPPGLSLGADGTLSGTPTAPGTWTVGYTVRNGRAPVFATPAAGSMTVKVLDQSLRSLSAGGEHSCGIQYDGTAWCWGANTWGQLGIGLRGAGRTVPTQVGAASDWAAVSAGGASTCAVRTSGGLFCWGLNNKGQLGNGTRTLSPRPVQVGTARTWRSVDAGWFTTCALRANQTLWCWGDNKHGQVGIGTHTRRWRPAQLPGTGWTSVSVMGWHACATKSDGSLWCWGRNTFGQLGDGTTSDRTTPTRVGTRSDWASVSTSWSHTCAVDLAGAAWCWGRDDERQLGDGTRAPSSVPVKVPGLPPVRQVAAGEGFTCALEPAGARWCWGSDDYGALGDEVRQDAPAPVQLDGSYQSLTAGWMHQCGLRMSGASRCWGNNETGAVGDDTRADADLPVGQVWP